MPSLTVFPTAEPGTERQASPGRLPFPHGLTFLFACYFFAFLSSELFFQNGVTASLGKTATVPYYAASLLAGAAGYLLYAACGRFSEALIRRFVVGSALLAGGFLLAAPILGRMEDARLLAGGGIGCALFLGYLGGAAHYVAAMRLIGGVCTGRVVGCGICFAVSCQYVMQILCPPGAQGVLISGIAVAAASGLSREGLTAKRALSGNAAGDAISLRTLGLTVVCVALMSFACGITDSLSTALHASGQLDLEGWQRLLYAAGALAAGGLADVRARAFMPVATLCALLLSMLDAVLLGAAMYASWHLSIMYFYSGFYVIYLTVAFLDAAPRSRRPMLWAGMGRISRNICVAVMAFGAPYLTASMGKPVLLMVNCLFLALMLLVLFLLGQLRFPDGCSGVFSGRVISDLDALVSAFAARHKLTPREEGVLAVMLATDVPLARVAEQMHISERVLQRHLTSIYAKTGTGTRVGLVVSFYGTPRSEH